jgi:hypothetical protein
MNFLQRYGRAARGNTNGHVVVRTGEYCKKRTWFGKLQKFVKKHNGETIGIETLTAVLTKRIRKEFRPEPEETCFGAFPNRAAYTAGLFWHALIKHPSMKGYQAKHLRTLQPAPSRLIYALLTEVRKMRKDPIFSSHVEKWCARFEAEARRLRDIGPKICIREPDGGSFEVLEDWLQKHTDILNQYPVCEGVDKLPEVSLARKLEHYLLDQRNFVKRQVEAIFPHSGYTERLDAGPEIVDHWCRKFKGFRAVSDAWERWPGSMEAALRLVQLTGLVVCDETVGMEASAQVL